MGISVVIHSGEISTVFEDALKSTSMCIFKEKSTSLSFPVDMICDAVEY